MSSDHDNIKLEIDHNKTSRRCSNISKFSYTHLNNSWVKEEITRATIMPAPRIDVSCLTWEGQQFQGKAAILEKSSSLPFQKIHHSIPMEDRQPMPDSWTISMVVGQLKADEDPHHGIPPDVPIKEYQ